VIHCSNEGLVVIADIEVLEVIEDPKVIAGIEAIEDPQVIAGMKVIADIAAQWV